MKWIVFWIWVQMIVVPCPQPEPTTDMFGRIQESTSYLLPVCYKSVQHHHNRVFATKEEAMAFIKLGEKESNLIDFRLEEIKEINIIE